MSEENGENRPSALARYYKLEEEIADTVLDPETPRGMAARLARRRPWLQKPAEIQRQALRRAVLNKK